MCGMDGFKYKGMEETLESVWMSMLHFPINHISTITSSPSWANEGLEALVCTCSGLLSTDR